METPEDLLDLVNKDVQRLDVLMSGLPGSRAINPVQWDSAIEFWKARIIKYCQLKKRVCFTTVELFQNFEFGDKKPWCLPAVVVELRRLGVILDNPSMDSKYSWQSWAAKYLVWTPISMSVGLISSVRSYLPLQSSPTNADKPHLPESFTSELFFIPSLIEEWSTKLQPKCDAVDSFDSLLTADEFAAKYLSGVDCQHSRRFILETWKSKGVVKHAVRNGKEMYKVADGAINDHDWNLFDLKISVRSFEDKILAREKQHDIMMDRVRKALKSDNKTEARRLLRQAKVMRDEIDKFKVAVERLQETKSTIDAAALNVQFLGVVKTGTKELKKLTSPKKLEEIEDAMADINEQTALAQEISSAISTPASGVPDMAELEAELAGLVLSAEKENTDKATRVPVQKVPNAPDFPATPVRRPAEPAKIEKPKSEEPVMIAN